jgi:hypothetical protein
MDSSLSLVEVGFVISCALGVAWPVLALKLGKL